MSKLPVLFNFTVTQVLVNSVINILEHMPSDIVDLVTYAIFQFMKCLKFSSINMIFQETLKSSDIKSEHFGGRSVSPFQFICLEKYNLKSFELYHYNVQGHHPVGTKHLNFFH